MKEEIVHYYSPHTKVPFYLEMAGTSYCDGSYRMQRKESRETVLEYIVQGSGYLNVDGRNYEASAGDVYILRKKTNHIYWSDDKNPWVKIFFNIRGSLAEKLLDEYNLGEAESVVLHAPDLKGDFCAMLETAKKTNRGQTAIFEQLAVDFLRLIIKLSNVERTYHHSTTVMAATEEELNTLIEYINMNQTRIVSNQELADLIFRSKNYVMRKFNQEFGVTPYEYQMQKKVFSACNMLENTKLSVGEIASIVGYDDQRYFATMFKRRMQMTPVQYRKWKSRHNAGE